MSLVPHRGLVLSVALSAIPVSASSQSVERIVYASVLDRAGRPVTDVAAKDLTVRENNIDLRRATESHSSRFNRDSHHAAGFEGVGDGDTAKPALGF